MNQVVDRLRRWKQFCTWVLIIAFIAPPASVYADSEKERQAEAQAKKYMKMTYPQIKNLLQQVETESFLEDMPEGWQSYLNGDEGQARWNNLSSVFVDGNYQEHRKNVVAWIYWTEQESQKKYRCYLLDQLRKQNFEAYTASGGHGTIARRDATRVGQMMQRVEHQTMQQTLVQKNVEGWTKNQWEAELGAMWKDYRDWYVENNAEMLSASIFEGTYCSAKEWGDEDAWGLILFGMARKAGEKNAVEVLKDIFMSVGFGALAGKIAAAKKLLPVLAKVSVGLLYVGAVAAVTETAHLFGKRAYVELGEFWSWAIYQATLIVTTMTAGKVLGQLPAPKALEGVNLNGFFKPPTTNVPSFLPAKPNLRLPTKPTPPVATKPSVKPEDVIGLGVLLKDPVTFPEEAVGTVSRTEVRKVDEMLLAVDGDMKLLAGRIGIKSEFDRNRIRGSLDIIERDYKDLPLDQRTELLVIRQLNLINVAVRRQVKPKDRRQVGVSWLGEPLHDPDTSGTMFLEVPLESNMLKELNPEDGLLLLEDIFVISSNQNARDQHGTHITNESDQNFLKRVKRGNVSLSDIHRLRKILGSLNRHEAEQALEILAKMLEEIKEKYLAYPDLDVVEVEVLRTLLVVSPTLRDEAWKILHALFPETALVEWVFGEEVYLRDFDFNAYVVEVIEYIALLDWFLEEHGFLDMHTADIHFFVDVSMEPAFEDRARHLIPQFEIVPNQYVELVIFMIEELIERFGFGQINDGLIATLGLYASDPTATNNQRVRERAQALLNLYNVDEQMDAPRRAEKYASFEAALEQETLEELKALIERLKNGGTLTSEEKEQIDRLRKHPRFRNMPANAEKKVEVIALVIVISRLLDPEFDILKFIYGDDVITGVDDIWEHDDPNLDEILSQALLQLGTLGVEFTVGSLLASLHNLFLNTRSAADESADQVDPENLPQLLRIMALIDSADEDLDMDADEQMDFLIDTGRSLDNNEELDIEHVRRTLQKIMGDETSDFQDLAKSLLERLGE